MTEIWQKIRKTLATPKHPVQFNTTKPMDHLLSELADAKAAWDAEQSVTSATRYITLLELVQKQEKKQKAVTNAKKVIRG